MDVSKAIQQLQEHVGQHSNNKYQNTPLNIEASLKEPRFTLLTAEKYLARYLATQGEKLAQPVDLLKACHFILFELQHRINQAEQEATKSQVKIDFDRIPYSHVGNIATKTLGMFFKDHDPSNRDLSSYAFGEIELTVHSNGYWHLTNKDVVQLRGNAFNYHDVDRVKEYLDNFKKANGLWKVTYE